METISEKTDDSIRNRTQTAIRYQTPGVNHLLKLGRTKSQPVTKTSAMENTKAMARVPWLVCVTVETNWSYQWRCSCTTENGNGNLGSTGTPAAESFSSISMEEYQAHIFGSFGLEEGKKKDDTWIPHLETDLRSVRRTTRKP